MCMWKKTEIIHIIGAGGEENKGWQLFITPLLYILDIYDRKFQVNQLLQTMDLPHWVFRGAFDLCIIGH